jgi:hypothetical protein
MDDGWCRNQLIECRNQPMFDAKNPNEINTSGFAALQEIYRLLQRSTHFESGEPYFESGSGI